MTMRTLDAGPLTLEPQTAAHATEMFAVLSDPAIYEYENAPPTSMEMAARRYESSRPAVPPTGGSNGSTG